MRKKRILFCSEATFLNTGYATYTREILNYLHNTGKYEIAEMASYGSPEDPRANTIPWKYYPVIPSKNAPPEQHKLYESKGTNQFGEWIFEQVCLDFLPDVVCDIRDFWMLDFAERSPYRPFFKWCFPADTPVSNGFGFSTPIQNVLIGDRVETHTGEIKTVSNTSCHKYCGLMTNIKAEGMAEPVKCTSDHEVLVVRKKKREWNNNSRLYKKNIESVDVASKEFVPASSVGIGDYLLLPIQQEGSGLNISNEKLWIIGLFLAEGCAKDRGRISFALHKNEKETLNRVDRFFSNETGKQESKEKGNGIVWRKNNTSLQEEYLSYYDDLGNKMLPPSFKELTKEQAKILLDGYFAGDGCVTLTNHNNPSIEMFSKSKILAKQIAAYGRMLGYPFRLNKRTTQDGYTIRMSGEKTIDFSKELVSDKSQNSETSKKPYTRAFIKDNYFLMPVVSVATSNEDLMVYDIEVEENHSFVTHCSVHNCIMPTVDARPQARQWIATYESADACFTYSDWAGEVLKDQSGGLIKYMGSSPPSAHPAYKPVEDKNNHKQLFGIDPKFKIIGTVMRNQRRKLYPDLFEAFRIFLDKSESKDYYLYCHTSYPDLGWDIPELLQQNQIASKVLFTYICNETKKPFASTFKGALAQSPFTGNFVATLSNVKNGASYEDLASIINLFDLYVQYANCEGFGLPIVEAAACGVPVMATDYSAMESEVRKLEGIPIKPKALYKELETGCLRAVPDNELSASLFLDFFQKMNDQERAALSKKTRQNFEQHFRWDVSGKKWEDYFDSVEILPIEKTWASPPRIHNPANKPKELPNNVSHSNLARWLITDVLGETDKIATFMEARLTRDLMYNTSTIMTGGMYFNESSAAFEGQQSRVPFNFDMAYNHMRDLCERRNHFERMRIQAVNNRKTN
jgi:glycosyltransferase involved in cell wall biosynthesis